MLNQINGVAHIFYGKFGNKTGDLYVINSILNKHKERSDLKIVVFNKDTFNTFVRDGSILSHMVVYMDLNDYILEQSFVSKNTIFYIEDYISSLLIEAIQKKYMRVNHIMFSQSNMDIEIQISKLKNENVFENSLYVITLGSKILNLTKHKFLELDMKKLSKQYNYTFLGYFDPEYSNINNYNALFEKDYKIKFNSIKHLSSIIGGE